MQIYRATELSAELKNGLETLLPQLSQSAQMPSSEQIENLLADGNTHLLVAEVDGAIAGILSLVVVNIPTGSKAWIEDVVVDSNFRGQKIGFQLVEKAKETALG